MIQGKISIFSCLFFAVVLGFFCFPHLSFPLFFLILEAFLWPTPFCARCQGRHVKALKSLAHRPWRYMSRICPALSTCLDRSIYFSTCFRHFVAQIVKDVLILIQAWQVYNNRIPYQNLLLVACTRFYKSLGLTVGPSDIFFAYSAILRQAKTFTAPAQQHATEAAVLSWGKVICILQSNAYFRKKSIIEGDDQICKKLR